MRRAAGVLTGLALACGAFAQDLTPQPVRNPYWGVALFDLYQDRSFAALTSLMASQHFERVGAHANEAELLRGALLLDIGVHTEAERIFTRLIEQGAAPAVRDRVWFHLAQLRFRKGLHGPAEEALARSGNALPPAFVEPRTLLQAQLQMVRGDFAGAATTLATVPPTSPLLPYARFNLAVARIKAGDAAGGTALLQALGTQAMASDELRSLRDKANLALGFEALRPADPASAVAALERVRLHSPQSHAALLGLGWAALQRKEPQRSLVAFRELAARPLRDAAVLEARIAEAHALAEAGAFGSALRSYEGAIAVYGDEMRGLDETIARARSGALIDALLEPLPAHRMGGALPLTLDPRLPQAGLLAPLLAEHDVQEALKNLHDLRLGTSLLAQGRRSLAIFDDMLAQRRAGFERRAPDVRTQAGALDPAARRTAIETLAAEVAAAQDAADGLAHADERERGLQQRLASARTALSSLDAGDEQAAALERLRLAQGALQWQLAREHPVRQWHARQGLAAVQASWSAASDRAAALEGAQREEPQRLQAFALRIEQLRARVATLAPQVAALAAEQQGLAQELAVAALARQQERLAGYAAQARWAVAQLVDRARVAQLPTGGADAAR